MRISDLTVDEEFESVIPPLTDEEFELLKESILDDGEVYHPLVVWNNIIVDGHHRYKILKEHPELKYRITKREFENRYEVISWICLNQLGRRNLSGLQKQILIGRKFKAEKSAYGETHDFRGNQYTEVVSPQNEGIAKCKNPTAEKIGKELGVSHATVERAEKIVDGVLQRTLLLAKSNRNNRMLRLLPKLPQRNADSLRKTFTKNRLPKKKHRKRASET